MESRGFLDLLILIDTLVLVRHGTGRQGHVLGGPVPRKGGRRRRLRLCDLILEYYNVLVPVVQFAFFI